MRPKPPDADDDHDEDGPTEGSKSLRTPDESRHMSPLLISMAAADGYEEGGHSAVWVAQRIPSGHFAVGATVLASHALMRAPPSNPAKPPL